MKFSAVATVVCLLAVVAYDGVVDASMTYTVRVGCREQSDLYLTSFCCKFRNRDAADLVKEKERQARQLSLGKGLVKEWEGSAVAKEVPSRPSLALEKA